MRKGQTLVEASALLALFAIFLIVAADLASIAESAMSRATGAVASYSGRLLSSRGEPALWDCGSGEWENGLSAPPLPLVLQDGTAINPAACRLGSPRPSASTCADYYTPGARLFSIPCQEMDMDILFASGEKYGHVTVVGAGGVYHVAVTRQVDDVIFRHSTLVVGW